MTPTEKDLMIQAKKEALKHKKNRYPFEYLKAMVEELPRPKDILINNKRSFLGDKPQFILNYKIQSTDLMTSSMRQVALLNQLRLNVCCLKIDFPDIDGTQEIIRTIKESTPFPILRGDLIIDEYQIYETLLHGGDSFTLCPGILDLATLQYFIEIGRELKMEPFLMVSSVEQFELAITTDGEILCFNGKNNDLNWVQSIYKKNKSEAKKRKYVWDVTQLKTPNTRPISKPRCKTFIIENRILSSENFSNRYKQSESMCRGNSYR